MQTHIKEKDYFPLSYTITRVLNSGVVMSIEKNEKELKGLKRKLCQLSGKKHAILFNADTGALHGALWGLGYEYDDKVNVKNLNNREKKLLYWLGLDLDSSTKAANIAKLNIDWTNINKIDGSLKQLSEVDVICVNFTDLSFGPCTALLTNDDLVAKRAERLIIFGAFDLRTMWTQSETELDVQPGLQMNYRLSPLVGACIKLSILRRNK